MCNRHAGYEYKKENDPRTHRPANTYLCSFLRHPLPLQKDVSLNFVFIILLLLYTFFFLSNIFLPVFKIIKVVSQRV